MTHRNLDTGTPTPAMGPRRNTTTTRRRHPDPRGRAPQPAEITLAPARPTSRATAYRPRRRTRRTLRRIAAGVVLVILLDVGISLATALRAPGDDTITKLAEWSRGHGLGALVTLAETVQYRLHPPASGGQPDLALLAPGAQQKQPDNGAGSRAASAAVGLPRIVGPVAPALPGEGIWVTAAGTHAQPLVRETYVRPDTIHTSYLAGIAWMSHTLSFVLHPGYQDPGTTGFTQPDMITTAQYPGLVATFNGGFKLADARGGIYDHGVTTGTLTTGAASFVVYADGHATVGTWGRDVTMTSDVVYVRQNLQPLITGSRIAPNLEANVQGDWGTTVGGSYAVWRSGIGVTSTGDLVYVAGDALSVTALAELLQRAGAITAMQLDINKSWVSYMTYTHRKSQVIPHKLLQFNRSADRYLTPTSRDFIAAYAR